MQEVSAHGALSCRRSLQRGNDWIHVLKVQSCRIQPVPGQKMPKQLSV